ncbi:MAG: non-canonical purine NTP pyrophosphatase [Patescibacteria group bacterium]|jgi:inosine/xanthosine triphosphate pyrophosphatase family protein
MKILIGTKNAYKSGEMEHLLKDIPDVEIIFLKDVHLNVTVEEDQASLLGNAKKKAREISANCDYYVLCSDGGMSIPGLGNKWDILRNQRIVGENSSDIRKVNNLLELMKDLKGEERVAEYSFALALGYQGKVLWSTEEITEKGLILEDQKDLEIPEYKWMGQLLYFPEYKNIHNKLTDNQRADLRTKSMAKLKNKLDEFITNYKF